MATGIPDLDTILAGGLPRGGIYLVEGMPGAGKTILGNQLCFRHAAQGGTALFVTLLTESHARMLGFMRTHTFYDESLLGGRIQYLSGFQTLENADLPGLLTLIRTSTRERRSTLLVIDGLNTAHDMAPTSLGLGRFLAELQLTLEALGCTAVLLSRPSADWGSPLHTMVDGVISLEPGRDGGSDDRVVRVLKLRGSAFLSGAHSYRISADGVRVYPRTELLYDPLDPGDTVAQAGLLPFGVARLDEMLAGGALRGSNTLIFGAPGTGKTLLSLQFYAAGIGAGEPGLYCSFSESPARLIAAAENIGLPLRAAVESGQMAFLWEPLREQPADALAARLLAAVEANGSRRLIIDGLDVLQRLVPAARFTFFLSALFGELRRRDVTTAITLELPQFFGPEVTVPVSGLAALLDGIIFLRTVELHSQLYRIITILKARERAADRALREFSISDAGIKVADTFASAEAILTGVARPLPPQILQSPSGRMLTSAEGGDDATGPRR